MAIEAYKGLNIIRQTLRKGYSVCYRFIRGESPDDSKDIFSFVAHFKTESAAKKHLKGLEDNHEIISFRAGEEPR